MESDKVPSSILFLVKSAIARIQMFNRLIEDARSLDQKLGSDGRYEADAWKNYGGLSAGQCNIEQLEKIKQFHLRMAWTLTSCSSN